MTIFNARKSLRTSMRAVLKRLAEPHKLYACHDRLLAYKEELVRAVSGRLESVGILSALIM
jgi:hypothetical protein